MKRYTLIVLLISIFVTPVYGKEYKSSFGFTVDIPEQWLVLTRQELKDNPDLFDLDDKQFRNVDKNLLKKVTEEIKLGRVEFYFNLVTSDISFADNINVGKNVGKIPENNDQLQKVCDMLPEQLSSYFGRRVRVYQCILKDVNGLSSLFLEFDGMIEGTTSIQYQIQKSPGVQLIITATCKNTSLKTIRNEFESIIYSIKMK